MTVPGPGCEMQRQLHSWMECVRVHRKNNSEVVAKPKGLNKSVGPSGPKSKSGPYFLLKLKNP
jgi:hypothetical protein